MKINELNYEHAVQHLTKALYWLTTCHFDARHNMLDEAEDDFNRCWEHIDSAVKLIQRFQDETKPF